MEQTKEFKLYLTSKTNIQLTDSILEGITTKKNYDLNGECVTEIQFGTRLKIVSESIAHAYLRTVIAVSEKDNSTPGVIIEVIYKGIFETTVNLNTNEFETWLDPQVVPQLLPYTRVLISNITNLMDIKTLNLPTIDILETLKINENVPEKGEVECE